MRIPDEARSASYTNRFARLFEFSGLIRQSALSWEHELGGVSKSLLDETRSVPVEDAAARSGFHASCDPYFQATYSFPAAENQPWWQGGKVESDRTDDDLLDMVSPEWSKINPLSTVQIG